MAYDDEQIDGKPIEDLMPIDCERKLRSLVNEMTRAERALRTARDDEIKKKHLHKAARRVAFQSPECPKPSRGGLTIADRDVWVEGQCATEERAYDDAVADREYAKDHLVTVREQATSVQSLLRSTWKAFEISGTTQHEGV